METIVIILIIVCAVLSAIIVLSKNQNPSKDLYSDHELAKAKAGLELMKDPEYFQTVKKVKTLEDKHGCTYDLYNKFGIKYGTSRQGRSIFSNQELIKKLKETRSLYDKLEEQGYFIKTENND